MSERKLAEQMEYLKAEIRDEIETRNYCQDQKCHCRLLADDLIKRLALVEYRSDKFSRIEDERDNLRAKLAEVEHKQNHKFVPQKQHPWDCDVCGYDEKDH